MSEPAAVFCCFVLAPPPFRRFGWYSVVMKFCSGTRNYLTRSCRPHSARLGEGRRPQVWALPATCHLSSQEAAMHSGGTAPAARKGLGAGGTGTGQGAVLTCTVTLHPGPSWASVDGDRSGRPPQPGAPSPPRLARCYLRSFPPTLAWSANRRGPDRACRGEMDCLG